MLLSLSAQSPFRMNPQYCLNEERAAGKEPVFHDPIWSFILVAYLNKMLGWCRGRTDRMLTDFCRQPLASSSEESTDGEQWFLAANNWAKPEWIGDMKWLKGIFLTPRLYSHQNSNSFYKTEKHTTIWKQQIQTIVFILKVGKHHADFYAY